MGVALGIAVIAAVGLGTWAALKDEKQTQRWLEDCIAREYRISKTYYRFQHLLKGNTVCHAERDGCRSRRSDPQVIRQDRPGQAVREIQWAGL